MKSIEIVMILGNRAIFISNYTICALLRSCLIAASNYIINVRIVLNGFNHDRYDSLLFNVQKYNDLLKKHGGGVTYEDYKGKTSVDFKPQLDGSYSCGEQSGFHRPMFKSSDIWDSFFQESSADFLAIIDDDCEILDQTLLKRMLDYMVQHKLDIFSVDRTSKRVVYDTYSKGEIVTMPRNDTWFCIYDMHQCCRNESFALFDMFITNEGDKYFWRSANWKGKWAEYEKHFRNESGIRYVYDDSAYLQSIIKKSTGKPYVSIHDVFDKSDSYIHYAHFASNMQIDSVFRTYLYRKLTIMSYKSRNKLVNRCRKILFGNADTSRLVDNKTSKLD